MKEHLPSFCDKKNGWWGGGGPLIPEISCQTDSVGAKTLIFIPHLLVASQP